MPEPFQRPTGIFCQFFLCQPRPFHAIWLKPSGHLVDAQLIGLGSGHASGKTSHFFKALFATLITVLNVKGGVFSLKLFRSLGLLANARVFG